MLYNKAESLDAKLIFVYLPAYASLNQTLQIKKFILKLYLI